MKNFFGGLIVGTLLSSLGFYLFLSFNRYDNSAPDPLPFVRGVAQLYFESYSLPHPTTQDRLLAVFDSPLQQKFREILSQHKPQPESGLYEILKISKESNEYKVDYTWTAQNQSQIRRAQLVLVLKQTESSFIVRDLREIELTMNMNPTQIALDNQSITELESPCPLPFSEDLDIRQDPFNIEKFKIQPKSTKTQGELHWICHDRGFQLQWSTQPQSLDLYKKIKLEDGRRILSPAKSASPHSKKLKEDLGLDLQESR